MAVHVVNRVPQSNTSNDSSQSNDETPIRNNDEQYHHAHTTNQNIIFGTIPLERTPTLNDSIQTIAIVRSLLDDLRPSFDINSEVTLRNNQETDESYTLSVTLRGPRLSAANSPAREQFDLLCRDLKKLAWMVATVKV